MAEPTSTNGLTTKDLLLQVLARVDGIDTKVDAARDSQIRTETILTEGKFGERISSLERFQNKAEGAFGLAKWALGGSGIALLLTVLNLLGVIKT